MKRVFLMRHGSDLKVADPAAGIWQPGAQLDPKGEGRIREAARMLRHLRGDMDLYWCSPYTRAQQTLQVIRHELGEARRPIITEKLAPKNPREWDEKYTEWLKGLSSDNVPKLRPYDFLRLWPGLMRAEAERMTDAIRSIAKILPPYANALAVCHSPLINLAEWAMTSSSPRDEIPYGSTLCFLFMDDGAFLTTEYLPLN